MLIFHCLTCFTFHAFVMQPLNGELTLQTHIYTRSFAYFVFCFHASWKAVGLKKIQIQIRQEQLCIIRGVYVMECDIQSCVSIVVEKKYSCGWRQKQKSWLMQLQE